MPTIAVEDAGCAGQPLETDRLHLRAVVASDAQAVARLAADPDVAGRTACMPHPYTLADAQAWVDRVRVDRVRVDRVRVSPDVDEIVRAIVRRADNAFLGAIGIIPDESGGELGYWLGKPYWGQGFVSEAVRRFVRFVFEELSLSELRASVFPDNPASSRVLVKAGFAFTGADTLDSPARGGRRITHAYAISRADWLANHALPTVLVAAAALVDADGRVLLGQRQAGKDMAAQWEFPGGKVAAGETPEAALIRELREELQIELRSSCLAPIAFASHRYASFHLLMPLYVCRIWHGDPQPIEHQALAWVRPMRLGDYKMPPADAPLVAMLRDFL